MFLCRPAFVTVSQCVARNQAVVCESACRVRGGCTTAQMVEFATKECADAVHTVHLHNADGKARRVPAFNLRVPNTKRARVPTGTELFSDPRRATQTCETQCRRRGPRRAPTNSLAICGGSAENQRAGSTLCATAELLRSSTPTSCSTNATQRPTACSNCPWSAAGKSDSSVRRHYSRKKKKAETFVSC